MPFTPIEIIALIFAILVIVKMIAIMSAPRKWYNLATSMSKNAGTWQIVYLILALLVGYYVLAELTFIQLVAAFLFSTLIIGISFWSYPNSFKAIVKEASNKKPVLPIVIYLIIALYTLYLLFM